MGVGGGLPFFQQDRYCTAAHAKGTPTTDTERLHYLAANLDLSDSSAAGWKLLIDEVTVLVR